MTRIYDFEEQLLSYLENFRQQIQSRPLNLGGISGSGGGSGGPPGGFVGQLPQSRVAFDSTEAEEWNLPTSGLSLLNNLNRIRYRLKTLEEATISGASISVQQNDVTVASNVMILNFTGASVTDNGSNKVTISISGDSGASTFLQLTDTPNSYLNNSNKYIKVKTDESGLEFATISGSGVDYFKDLLDTPSSYTGHAGKSLIVNQSETGIEFSTISGGVSSFTSLTDTPSSYTGSAYKILRVNSSESGIEFITPTSGELPTFIDLIDTPVTYSGNAGKVPIVNISETGLDFVTISGFGGGFNPYFYVDGVLTVGTNVSTEWIAPFNGRLYYAYVSLKEKGDSGTTTIDVNKNGTSVFSSSLPTINYNDTAAYVKIPVNTNFNEGDKLTLDIDETAEGASSLFVILTTSTDSGSGGGGGGDVDLSGAYDVGIDHPDNWAYSSYNQEFSSSGTSLPSGWSFINQGSSTFVIKKSALVVYPQPASPINFRFVGRSFPSETNWTCYIKVSESFFADADWHSVGLAIRESSTGRFIVVMNHRHKDNGLIVPVERWWSSTSFDTSLVGGDRRHTPVNYFAIRKDGSNYDFGYSSDGLDFSWVLTGQSVSGFMTPNQICFAFQTTTGRPGTSYASLYWMRFLIS